MPVRNPGRRIAPSLKIGVDGGGTKTECVLIDAEGGVVARRVGPGCNPSVVGRRRARGILLEQVGALKRAARGRRIEATLLCMAGAADFWEKVAAGMRGCGKATATPDSEAVLEMASARGAALVLHAGTGSFVAARKGAASFYAGGSGWRFGDEGGGYDIGRRAVARALLESQGWAPKSGIATLVRSRMERAVPARSVAAAIKSHYYSHPAPNGDIADLAPAVLRLADRGDKAAIRIVEESVGGLLDLADSVASRLFPGRLPVPAGLSGPILSHPAVRRVAGKRKRFRFFAVEGRPIEGVRSLLVRKTA